MQLSDYAQALSAAQNLVPNWRQDDFDAASLQGAQLQNQTNQFRLQQAQQQVQDQQAAQAAFKTDVASLGANPSADSYRKLAIKYPQFHEAIDGVAKGIDEASRQKLVTNLAPVVSLIQNKQYDSAAKAIKRHIDADTAAGLPADENDQELYDELTSGDPTRQAAAGGVAYALLNQLNPDTAAKNLGDAQANKTHVISQGGALVDDTGKELYRSAPPETNALEVPIYNDQGQRVGTQLVPNGGRGGGQASAGGADTSRLINTDAGGGYVPDSVQTLGQFVAFGRGLNARGAKSSSAGTYQINGSTMQEFAPQALGQNWQSQPYNAQSQDKIGETIFNWAKAQPNPAAALQGRWVSLSRGQAAQLVKGDWSQARDTIAQGETGGGSGASANAPSSPSSNGYFGPQGGQSADDGSVTGEAYLKTLTPGRANMLRAINEGRAPAPRPGTKYGEAVAEDLARAYPGADATTFAAKQQTRKDFTGSGKNAASMASYNRFAAHLNSAWAIHLRLPGPNLGPLSGMAAGTMQSFSPKDVNAYNTEIDGIQGEFQKLTKLGVANEGEANRLIHAARAAQSAEGRAGALEAMARLVAGAYQPQVAQWRSAFPNEKLPVDVTPGAKAVINNVIHGGKRALPTGSSGAPSGNARGFTPSGFTHMSASGKYGYVPGRGWVAVK